MSCKEKEVESAKPLLGLHVCCGPCATVAIERLLPRFRLVCIWYNPNIYPPEEYQRRLANAIRACESFGLRLQQLSTSHRAWLEAVRGLEDAVEGRERCDVCIGLRLRAAAEAAAQAGCEYLCTTLTVGPQKNAEQIHRLGEHIAGQVGLRWLAETFRKKDGFRRSVELSRKLGLYRQDYCGCEFSLRQRRRQSNATQARFDEHCPGE